MKRFLILLMMFQVAVFATAQSADMTLAQVVKQLEDRFEVSISYDAGIKVKFTEQQAKEIYSKPDITSALDLLTSYNNMTYKKLRADYFVISEGNNKKGNNNLNDKQTTRTIKGLILDEENLPVLGAIVRERWNGKHSTMSDLSGNFTLKVSDTASAITVSMIGYRDKVVVLDNKDYYKIVLEKGDIEIQSVVVSGVAGATPEKKLTITVNHLDNSTINQAPASSASSALQGKIPGVVITQPSGEPGSSASIRLRGVTSMMGRNTPLIIVDGVMVQTSLSDFNVDDIESIEVVKGAAASALYGSKAAGGVIVITTKRGKNIKSDYQITVRNEFGTTQLQKYVKLATHHPYVLDSNYTQYPYTRYAGVEYDDEGNPIRGSRILNDSAYADQPYAIIRNHQELFFKKGNYFTNYISLASKNNISNLFLSFENHHNEGIIFHTKGYTRRNFRFNSDMKLGRYIKISTSNLLINSTSDRPGSNSSFFDLLFINPDVDLTAPNEDGTPYKINPDPWSIEENPLYPLYYRERKKLKTSFLSNFKMTVTFAPWLNLVTKYSYEKLNIHYNTITPPGYLYGGGATINGSLYKEQYTSTNQVAQSTLNFHKIFGNFTVKSKLSYMYEDQYYEDFSVTGRDFIVPNIPQLDNTDPSQADLNSYDGTIRAIDIFAIADIDYKSKYLFSGLYRKDGSSLFGENQRWHDYYRIAGAYRISEDIKIPGFQELKLRAAYGTSGLRPGFSWQYETWSINNGFVSKQTLGNKDLKPAEARELEIALDADFLKRFGFYGSYSITKTIGAFALAPLPSYMGYAYQWQNVGDLEAKVWEFSLSYAAIQNKNTTLNFQINFDRIRQKLISLGIPPYSTGPKSAYYLEPGQSFGILYGYDWVRSLDQMKNQLPEGRTIDDYTVNSDGYVILKGTEGSRYEAPIPLDLDNDGNPDKVIIGDGNPDFNMDFATTLTIKNFTFYFLINWKKGGDVYNYTHQFTFRDARAIEFDQYGKPDNAKKSLYYYMNFYNQSINSYFVEDGSYVKIREISAYYTLKPKSQFLHFVKSLRIGLVGRNIFTFTKYSGYDPEVATSGDLTTFAFDDFNYPNFRTITGSLQVKF